MNTRLAVAAHILTYIEALQGEPARSEAIAASVNTNAALVRRLLSQLSRAGLTKSQMGSGGGALLGRSADKISLLDIYRAVDGADLLGLHESPNRQCPVGRQVKSVLLEPFGSAQQAFVDQLAETSIADLAAQIAQANSTH